MVKTGQKITITANGEIVLASLSNNKYYPSGKTVTSSTSVEGATEETAATSTSTYPIYGNVVYKIGETGTALKAGDKFNGKATLNGILYLSIYETVYNAANSGSYSVKVKVK